MKAAEVVCETATMHLLRLHGLLSSQRVFLKDLRQTQVRLSGGRESWLKHTLKSIGTTKQFIRQAEKDVADVYLVADKVRLLIHSYDDLPCLRQ